MDTVEITKEHAGFDLPLDKLKSMDNYQGHSTQTHSGKAQNQFRIEIRTRKGRNIVASDKDSKDCIKKAIDKYNATLK